MTRAVVLTIAALTFAACGEESGAGPGGTGTDASAGDAADGAFKFAACMRENGVDFPDPEVDGGRIRLGGRHMKINPEDPKFRAAQQNCGKHLERGGPADLSPEQQAAARDAGVKFAECMRANGVENMPDPQADGSMIIRRRGESSTIDPQSPAFQAAEKKCDHLLAKIRDAIEKGEE